MTIHWSRVLSVLLSLSFVTSFRPLHTPRLSTTLHPLFPGRLSSLSHGVGVSVERSASSSDNKSHCGIRPTLADCARTVAHVCKSGTLSTISENGHPLGSPVDYVLSKDGHPMFFFSKSTSILPKDPRASFFCKMPLEYEHISSLSSRSTSIQGELIPVSKKEANSLKITFSLTHPHYTDHLCNNDDIFFVKLKPSNVLFLAGDFGAKPVSLGVPDYEAACPDILAQEVPFLLPRLNIERQYELRLLCKHILEIPEDVYAVSLQAIDKLGIDIRVVRGK